jgi:hypothetical protein
VVDDKNIAKQVKAELESEPVFKFNNVDVKTYEGVVQLSGFVSSEEQKQRAGQLAQVPGVVRVINNITLKPEVMPTGRPGGTNVYPSAHTTHTSKVVPPKQMHQ